MLIRRNDSYGVLQCFIQYKQKQHQSMYDGEVLKDIILLVQYDIDNFEKFKKYQTKEDLETTLDELNILITLYSELVEISDWGKKYSISAFNDYDHDLVASYKERFNLNLSKVHHIITSNKILVRYSVDDRFFGIKVLDSCKISENEKIIIRKMKAKASSKNNEKAKSIFKRLFG